MTLSVFSAVIFALLGGAVLGAGAAWLLLQRQTHNKLAAAQTAAQRELELAVSGAQLSERTATANMREELAARNAEITQLEGLVATLRDANAKQDARNVADNQVLQQLAPVAQQLQVLRERVEGLEQQRAAQHGELVGQLQQSAQAEQRLLSTSQQLAQALTATNTRGQWGESTLQRIFEATGMQEHIDFTAQNTLQNNSGSNLRPDFLVHLPGERVIAIDAKAPLAALLNLPAAASPAELKQAQQAHVAALKKHVKELGGREYQSSLPDSLDMVLAFIPSDDLLGHAFAADPQLHDYAFNHKVMLVSPATLYATLKAVEHSWRKHQISSEAQELHALSTELYKRLSSIAEHLTRLGSSLSKATADYNALLGSIESRFLPTARRIEAIDPALLSDTTKNLPGQKIVQAPRLPAAPELNTETN